MIPVASPLPGFGASRAAFHSGDDTPRAYLERCLEIVEAREPVVRAFVSFDAASARQAADAATDRYRAGKPLSVIDGCPIGVKDIIETRDFPTQMNSPHFEGWESGRDAASVRALRSAGAVVLGKTHTTEFAIGNSAPTTNPHDARRTPGGSSSGSAAAAGAGMVPVALGTQTAGSILRPASYCGAFGFKPTHGTLTVAGIHPLARSLDHLGTIAGTLEDAWVTAHLIWAGGGSDAPAKGIPGPGLPEARRPSRGLIWLRTAGWPGLDSESEQAFAACVKSVTDAGVPVLSASDDPDIAALEAGLRDVSDLNNEIVKFEIRYPMGLYRDRDASLLGPRITGLLADGDGMRVEEHVSALEQRAGLIAQVFKLATRYDGYLTMASTGPAPEGFAFTGERTFLSPWSVIGGPAFSLPVMKIHGLPAGLQVMGAPGSDAPLAAIANWLLRI